MQPTIGPGTVDDLDAVLELWKVAQAEPTHTDDLESLRKLLAHDPGALLVARVGEQLVCSVIAGWDGWRGSIYRLAVAPGHRRQGLARELVGAAEQRLQSVGAARLQATVVDNDERAMGFWSAVGWERQSHRARFVTG